MVQKSIRKLVVRGILDTANTHSLDHSFSRVGTDTPIKCDGVKLVLWDQGSSLSEAMRYCKCFPL